MGTMTYETAMAWLRLNRLELKQAAERGHKTAQRAMEAYMHAREVWSPVHTLEFERRARSFCDALNDFCVEELNKTGRAELRGKYDYKIDDLKLPD
jgi:hypothetical protein